MKARPSKNKKAALAFNLEWIIKTVIFLLITSTAYAAMSGSSSTNARAEMGAKNLGMVLETATLTPGDILIRNECPNSFEFTINDDIVSATFRGVFGKGQYSYHYLAPDKSDSTLPSDVKIDCKRYNYIEINKTLRNVGGVWKIEMDVRGGP